MNDNFSFRNRSMRIWLPTLAIVGALVAALVPPSIGICVAGVLLLATDLVTNSARTDQRYSWQNEGSLNWFEGWAAASGIVLVIIPLLTLIGGVLVKA